MFTFTHRNPEMKLGEKKRVALVLADMQNEFLEEKTGTYYALIEDALKKRNVIANLERLLATAQTLGYFIIHSPHWYYPTDRQWSVPLGAIGHYLGGIGFCGRKDPVDLEPESLEVKKSFAPLNRYGEVADVVRAVENLEDADFVTGEISYVDGGRTAGH